MRTKTKSRKQNEKRRLEISKQTQNAVKKSKRKHVKDYDLEKAAIVYLHLFRKVKDVEKIDYSTFYDTWIKWFPEDSYGCGTIIKQSFRKTVESAGNTEESISSYRDSVKFFSMDTVTSDDMKELKEIAKRKGCTFKRAKDLNKNLSGFCIKKVVPSNYQFRKSNVLMGERYDVSFKTAKKYISNLPDIEDLKAAQDKVKSVLILPDATIREKVDAIHEYPYYIVTYDFELYLSRFVMKCDSWGVLKAVLQLSNKVHALNAVNEKPLDIRANRNAKKSLEELGLFSNDSITRKVIASCIRNSGISTDCTEWTKEDFDKFTEELSTYRPQKYQYIRDRFPKQRDYKLWILSKHTGKGYKTLEKEMAEFLK